MNRENFAQKYFNSLNLKLVILVGNFVQILLKMLVSILFCLIFGLRSLVFSLRQVLSIGLAVTFSVMDFS